MACKPCEEKRKQIVKSVVELKFPVDVYSQTALSIILNSVKLDNVCNLIIPYLPPEPFERSLAYWLTGLELKNYFILNDFLSKLELNLNKCEMIVHARGSYEGLDEKNPRLFNRSTFMITKKVHFNRLYYVTISNKLGLDLTQSSRIVITFSKNDIRLEEAKKDKKTNIITLDSFYIDSDTRKQMKAKIDEIKRLTN
ncbi:MAG: hypothetical protein ACTSYR_02070 [Candidatus Odinarchaeia archaeon]